MNNETDLNAPEHCLQAWAICIQDFATYSHGPIAVKKLLQDAMHYHAGALTGLQKLRDERDKFKLADHWLGELLACIHRDGGHYLGSHGIEKATKDAIAAYYAKVKALDELQPERDLYRAALGLIASQWAQPARDIARKVIAEAYKKTT